MARGHIQSDGPFSMDGKVIAHRGDFQVPLIGAIDLRSGMNINWPERVVKELTKRCAPTTGCW